MHPEDHNELAKRGANTQSLFRLINERVEDLNQSFRGILELQHWICECAKQTCVESIALSLGEYEDIRANPLRFVVAPSDDHVFEELFDDAVEKNDRFWVIEKRGTAAEIAAREDPRKAHVNLGLRRRS